MAYVALTDPHSQGVQDYGMVLVGLGGFVTACALGAGGIWVYKKLTAPESCSLQKPLLNQPNTASGGRYIKHQKTPRKSHRRTTRRT